MKSPRSFWRIPPPLEVLVLRALQGERQARAYELVDVSRGRISRNQVWMLMQRLKKRGAIRVAKNVAAKQGGQRLPVYALTKYGRAVLKAVHIMEAASG